VELRPIDVRDGAEIERAITAFARGSNGGLIVTTSGLALGHRELIITLATRHRLPAVSPYRLFVSGGGLISYGADTIDPHRRAASYVDRILKGEKPADLPVQAPVKYELVINLKTAKSLVAGAPRARRRDRGRVRASQGRHRGYCWTPRRHTDAGDSGHPYRLCTSD
jgi:putative tryptophan/tyrosine transport system substrate-binding protein